MSKIPEREGRQAFGANVQGYDESRPEYPEWIFDLLTQEGVIFPSASTLEIGPGNGLATRVLVEKGISRLTMLEPDRRFAPFLEDLRTKAGAESKVLFETLEAVELPEASFDLALVATTFHWLDPETRVKKLAKLTKQGGCVVLIWNVFQDLNLHDAFHEATKDILAELSNSPSGAPDSLPFALDRQAREAEFLSTGNFETRLYAESHWKFMLDPKGVRSLYESFSQIARLQDSEREALLDQLEAIAKSDFGGSVVRNMSSPLYVFQRT